MKPKTKVLIIKAGIGLVISAMFATYIYIWIQWVDLEGAQTYIHIANSLIGE